VKKQSKSSQIGVKLIKWSLTRKRVEFFKYSKILGIDGIIKRFKESNWSQNTNTLVSG
jgi:hypothetical protein